MTSCNMGMINGIDCLAPSFDIVGPRVTVSGLMSVALDARRSPNIGRTRYTNERLVPGGQWVHELVTERTALPQIHTPLTIGIVRFRSSNCGSSCTNLHRWKRERQQTLSRISIRFTDRVQQIVLPDSFLGSSTESTKTPETATRLNDKQRQHCCMRNSDNGV